LSDTEKEDMMRFLHGISAFCVLILSAQTATAEFKRISSEAEFKTLLTGKKLVGETAWFVLKANGMSTGKIGDENWVGAWVWNKGAYCSNGRIGTKPELGTKCHFWEVDGDKARLLRDRGKGETTVYRIK
jgi:hypothetical protein